MSTRYLRLGIMPYSVKPHGDCFIQIQIQDMHISLKTSKNVAVHKRVNLSNVVVVAKNIKRHFNDRYKGFAHCILLFKSIVASINVIAMSFFLVHRRSSQNIKSSKIDLYLS